MPIGETISSCITPYRQYLPIERPQALRNLPAVFHSESVIPRHEPSMTNMIRIIKEIVPIFLFKLSGIFSLCEI